MNYNRLIAYAFIAATMTGFTSCSDDDEPMPKDPDFPTLSSGAYVLNQGSYSKKIEGALNVIDYTTATIADDVFTKANNRSLGSTPQCGIAYGGKIYLGMYGSKTIEIIDRYTYKSVQQIRLDESTQGQSPRNMVAKEAAVAEEISEQLQEKVYQSKSRPIFQDTSDSVGTYYLYIVKENDSYGDVATRYSVDENIIRDYNQDKVLEPGSVLIIPYVCK